MELNELNIILVEPSTTQSGIIKRQLQELGIGSIESVTDGRHALKSMRNYTPDLVISSLYLPDSSGTELLQIMRIDDQLRDIPFMLISSETRFRQLDPIRQAGSIAILPKPFNKDQLQQALNATVELIEPSNSLELEDINPEELRVLLVDDSSTARQFIKRILTGLGIERIDEATNGIEAIKLIKDNFYDLLLTDYNMPEMNGQELVDYIRKHSEQKSVPILMISSENNQSRLAAIQQSGVSALCNKQMDSALIKGLLESIL